MGTTLGRYRIDRALGAGGMGAVYEATHIDIGKVVALKVLAEDLATDARARARFLREAEAVSKIDHPNVVKVTDYGAADDSLLFIVMQLFRGEDLGSRLDRLIGGLTVGQTADIMLGVCAGVSAAHQAGVIHRDLKPSNIFLARGPGEEISAKVLDFGISKVLKPGLSASLTDPGAILGTTPYLSPEQVTGAEVDVRTDQYALGVVLYECLTGHRPYDDDNRQVLLRSIQQGKFPAPSRLRGDLPPALEAAVLRALATVREARFPTVRALGAALFPFASPKVRAAWADFLGAPMLAQPAHGRAPETERYHPRMNALVLAAPAPLAPLQTSPQVRPDAQACPPTEPQEAHGLSETRTHEARSIRKGKAAPWIVAAAGALAVVLAALHLSRSSTPPIELAVSEPVAPATATSEIVAPPAPAGAAASVVAESEPAAAAVGNIPDGASVDVTIYLADAPSGLVAILEGQEVRWPLRVRRGSRALAMTFRAPGYEEKRLSISPLSDQTVVLGLRPSLSDEVLPPAERHPLPSRRSPAPEQERSEYILKL